MNRKDILLVLLVPTFLLLIPAVGMRVSDEWNWGPESFVLAWVLMVGVGFAYKFVTRKAGTAAYRFAAALALGTAFMLLWINAAVGLIGSEDNPANLMYGGVLAVGAIGAAIARFAPLGMARALFATALAQFLVPVVAVIVWRPDFSPGVVGVFGLNFFFVLMFAGSAILFRHAGSTPSGGGAQTLA